MSLLITPFDLNPYFCISDGFLQSPGAVAGAATIAVLAVAQPPLPTFVPQGTAPPNVGGGGGGVLPSVALAVRI